MDIEKYVSENFTQNENGLIERVACYIRVSTQEQKLHGLSLDAQRDTLKRFAKMHGLKIVEWYEDEGVSGRKLIKRRPALQRMLNDAQKGKFDRIIFIKLDRYFRSVAEYHECQKILESNSVLWTATEEKYDLTTASGRFWINQKISMAEYEADNTGERIRLVNEYKIRTGQPLTGAQSQGIAYTVAKDNETGLKKVVPDPETKDLCMDYINHFLVYHNKKAAMAYVNEKYGTNYGYNSLTLMLKDTKICGHYKGNDEYCEPYIDRKTFDHIQDLLKSNIKEAQSKRVYIFTGLMHCPHCGRNLSAHWSQVGNGKTPKKAYKAKSRKQEIRGYHYYRCNNYCIEKKCDFNKRINEFVIENYLLSYFDVKVKEYIELGEIEEKKAKNNHAADLVKQLKGEITRLNNMYRKSRISDAEYDRDYEELEKRLKHAESLLLPVKEKDLSKYKKLLKSDWKKLYNALNAENKRAFWRKYINTILVNEDGTVKEVIFF